MNPYLTPSDPEQETNDSNAKLLNAYFCLICVVGIVFVIVIARSWDRERTLELRNRYTSDRLDSAYETQEELYNRNLYYREMIEAYQDALRKERAK